MPPKLSPIWRYFEESPGDPSTALCKVPGCKNAKVSRGKQGSSRAALSNTSLTRHLQNQHKKEHQEFLGKKDTVAAEKRKAEEAVVGEMENIPLYNLRTNGQRQNFLHQSNLTGWVGSQPSVRQSPSSTYDIHDARAKERHRGVLMMVVLDLQPWSIVNNPGFLHYSYQLDPHFKLASDTFYRNLLDKAFKKSVKKVEEKIEADDPQSVSCQLDGWSAYRHGYIGLLINYITPGWKRVSLCLACGQFDTNHTGENMGNWLDMKLESWKVIDKTTVCVSDTASNMLKMMEYLPNSMEHNDCLNHVFQLSINDEILEKPEIKNIIANVRAFTNYTSVLLSSALRKRQEELGWEDKDIKTLVQDVKTRWNSTHDMLARFAELEEPIKKILDDEVWKNKIKCGSASVKLSSNDWKVIKNTVKVLGSFKEATLELSKASACISQAIPIITSVLHMLKPTNTETDIGVKNLKRRLSENLANRVRSIETSEIHALATLLDPRYRNCYFRDAGAKRKAEEKLLDLLKSESVVYPLSRSNSLDVEEVLVPNNISGGLAAAFEEVKKRARRDDLANEETPESVLKDYMSEELEKTKNLAWWQKYEEEAKGNKLKLGLCRLAKKFLTPPPTSTNCERLFSVAGQIMDEKRAKMLPDNLERILFLRENIMSTNFTLDW